MSSPFLTPPLIAQSNEHDPFKASALDKTSLSMKKRHHPRHNQDFLGRPYDSSSEPTEAYEDDFGIEVRRLPYSKSLPNLPIRESFLHQRGSFTAAASTRRQDSTGHVQRRWTLPYKASSTRGLSTFSPTYERHVTARKKRHRASPALITLRRATNRLHQGTDYTFFPPPKFTQNGTSLVSAFLRTMTGESQIFKSTEELAVRNERSDRFLPKYTVSTKALDRSRKDKAAPAITEVSVEPVVSESLNGSASIHRRRCSTKFITKSSVHEIIWDENDTPTDSSEASPGPKVAHDANSRRESVAVAQLEDQLYKSVLQSRRTSAGFAYSERFGIHQDPGYERSFQRMLDFSLSRLINESALWNLPRSKASQRPRSFSVSIAPNAPAPSIVEESHPTRRHSIVEVFPPFQSCGAADLSIPESRSLSRTISQTDLRRYAREPSGSEAESGGESRGGGHSQAQKESMTRAYLPGRNLFGRPTGNHKMKDESVVPLLSDWEDGNLW